jgi:hypothetical protein
MVKRGLTFKVDDDNPMTSPVYVTTNVGWTLASCELSAPVQKTSYIDKPGGDGAWDLSTTMTDGIPRYQNRTLTATLELSAFDRSTRDAAIRSMVNTLAGRRLRVFLPDDPSRYLVGRVHVERKYNNLSHASVIVTMDCDPWKYNVTLTSHLYGLTTTASAKTMTNTGGRTVVPTIEVGGEAKLVYGTASISFSKGKYQWPELLLTPGSHQLKVSGSSSLVISYREAVLE